MTSGSRRDARLGKKQRSVSRQLSAVEVVLALLH